MKLEVEDRQNYLQSLPELSMDAAEIRWLGQKLFTGKQSEEQKIQAAFSFVRDEIGHSWDIQKKEVTKTALETLTAGHGICYAKSNLLAALLRNEGIPTGFCYQRLLLLDEAAGIYCIHALNAVYLSDSDTWLRIDARGNKPGVSAIFAPPKEVLAFTPDAALGEIDYPVIYCQPAAITMRTLDAATDALEMYLHELPTALV